MYLIKINIQVWGEARSAPPCASLEGLLHEAQLGNILLEGLKSQEEGLKIATAKLLGSKPPPPPRQQTLQQLRADDVSIVLLNASWSFM
jgi:hypothetical protein